MKGLKSLVLVMMVVSAVWSFGGATTAAVPVPLPGGAALHAPASPVEEMLPPVVSLVKHSLCGRGLSGRCTKGRGACSRGTPEQCATWTAWSKACSTCAAAFAACRQRVGHRTGTSCDACVAKHDACEAKLRT
jgi:hypothetical protein